MPPLGYDSTVLLTGFPGFEARLLLDRILASEPNALVYVLVSQADAALARTIVCDLPGEHRGRLVLLEGDPAGIDLGLSGQEYLEVRSRVERAYLFAAVTSQGANNAEASYVNMQAAIEAVQLAREASRLKCLVLRSSASVSGTRRGLVREDDPIEDEGFHNPIEESLAHAERIARRAIDKGLPIAIVRPSTVIGDSKTGEIDRMEGPYTLILLILNSPAELALPLPGRGDTVLNVVPVDYVVAAAHQIGRDPRSPGRTFHLVDPVPLPTRRVFELVAQAAGRRSPRGHIPSYVARAVLGAPGLQKFVRSPRAFVEDLATPVRYDARNTEELLERTGIVCPPFESYVDRIVAWARERARQRRSQPPRRTEDDDPLS